MKVLLDECVPRKFAALLPGHSVTTVVQAGWKGIANGELLKTASENFDVFISVDRNISFQLNVYAVPVAIIVIHSLSTRLKDIQKFAPAVLKILEQPLTKNFYHVGD
ncbi:MAG: hypothetical protein EPO31_00890 [Gammaproteobacteria bacterium]|nr:MAG: hypothetical protein EPO31_00890 [Gammaproteobacteria bacterium]